MAVTSQVLNHRFKQELPDGINDLKIASFDKSLIHWLVLNKYETIIKNLSLALQNIARIHC